MKKGKLANVGNVVSQYNTWWNIFISQTTLIASPVDVFQTRKDGENLLLTIKTPIWLKNVNMDAVPYQIFIQGEELVNLRNLQIVRSNITVSYFERIDGKMVAQQVVRYDYHPDCNGAGHPIFHGQIGSLSEEEEALKGCEAFRGYDFDVRSGKYIKGVRIPTPFLGFFGVVSMIVADCCGDQFSNERCKIPEPPLLVDKGFPLCYHNALTWYES